MKHEEYPQAARTFEICLRISFVAMAKTQIEKNTAGLAPVALKPVSCRSPWVREVRRPNHMLFIWDNSGNEKHNRAPAAPFSPIEQIGRLRIGT